MQKKSPDIDEIPTSGPEVLEIAFAIYLFINVLLASSFPSRHRQLEVR